MTLRLGIDFWPSDFSFSQSSRLPHGGFLFFFFASYHVVFYLFDEKHCMTARSFE